MTVVGQHTLHACAHGLVAIDIHHQTGPALTPGAATAGTDHGPPLGGEQIGRGPPDTR